MKKAVCLSLWGPVVTPQLVQSIREFEKTLDISGYASFVSLFVYFVVFAKQ